jgi:hypothetical protein
MARPQKEGLGYFPMDVDIDQDDKLIVPIAKHGMAGFGVIVKLMMEIYRNGYFYPWTDKEKYVFPFKIAMEKEKVSEIVDDCVEAGFFDKEQFEKNQILTSFGFQKRFLMASTRRKDSLINERFKVGNGLLQTETELLHAETPEMSAISTQSKVKESKLNKSKLIDCIFAHWKSKNLIKHRAINPHIKNQITWKLEHYTADEICSCITAYDIILNDPVYKLDTRWSLDGFLEKNHFEKFLPDRDPYTFYPKVVNDLAPQKQSKLSKNKALLRGKGGGGHVAGTSQVSSFQSSGSLPEPN